MKITKLERKGGNWCLSDSYPPTEAMRQGLYLHVLAGMNSEVLAALNFLRQAL